MEQQLLTAAETDPAVMVHCVDECERCHRICLRMAMTHCLEQGGEHAEPAHLRLMLAYSAMCRAASDALLASFDACEDVCALCARICEQCAQSCERLGDLQECVEACRRCAQSCLVVTGAGQAEA